MPLQTFRHYTICQDRQGATVEVWRGPDEVACLAFDNQQRSFVELHISIASPERARDAASFQQLLQRAIPLRHRHLLSICDGGQDEGANYFVSAYLDGERLDRWLARSPLLPPWLALLLIRQLIEGLAALASQPLLLAGVEVLHAGLSLSGPHPGDLLLRLGDFGLPAALPDRPDPHLVEARAIQQTGRLLARFLMGNLVGDITPELLASRALPPELAFLLNTIFTPTAPHHPCTLEQLRTLVERCARDFSPELTAPPESLPAAFLPRLPLAQLLPDAAETAESLSDDLTLDPRRSDAADPYRLRGTQRSTRRPVNVQVLPPPNLLPSPFLLPQLEKAWSTLATHRDPHLLAPLAFHPAAPSPTLVEELPGKWTLDSLRRLRPNMAPAEALLLLDQIDAAAQAAESLGLPLHWRSPRLVPLHFLSPGGEASLPHPSRLARLPLTEWPPFALKLRSWPTALDFTQPDRFQWENLLPRDPALSGEAPTQNSPCGALPSARDLALLTVWLLGGSPKIPESLKPLLYAAISTRGPTPTSRSGFLQRFHQRLAAPSPAAPPVRPTPVRRSAPRAVPSPHSGSEGTASAPLGLFDPALGSAEPLVPQDEASPVPQLGFAEALFGTPSAGPLDATSPDLPENPAFPLWPIFSDASPSALPPSGEAEPWGFMEALSPSQEAAAAPPARSGSPWILALVVVLIAAALAALMAHFSGQALWLK